MVTDSHPYCPAVRSWSSPGRTDPSSPAGCTPSGTETIASPGRADRKERFSALGRSIAPGDTASSGSSDSSYTGRTARAVASSVGPSTASTALSAVNRLATAGARCGLPPSSSALNSRRKGLPLRELNCSTARRAPCSWARPAALPGPLRSAWTPMVRSRVRAGEPAAGVPSSRRAAQAPTPPPATRTAPPAASSNVRRDGGTSDGGTPALGASARVGSMSGSASISAERSAIIRTTSSGSQSTLPSGASSMRRTSSPSAVGRSAGSLARHSSSSPANSLPIPSRSGASWTVR